METIADRVKERSLLKSPWTSATAYSKMNAMVNNGANREEIEDAQRAWSMRDNDGTGDMKTNMNDFMNKAMSKGGKKSKRRRSTKRRSTKRRSTKRRSTKRR